MDYYGKVVNIIKEAFAPTTHFLPEWMGCEHLIGASFWDRRLPIDDIAHVVSFLQARQISNPGKLDVLDAGTAGSLAAAAPLPLYYAPYGAFRG